MVLRRRTSPESKEEEGGGAEWTMALSLSRKRRRRHGDLFRPICTAVLSEAWAKLCDWASAAGRGRLLLSGSIAHASLKIAVI